MISFLNHDDSLKPKKISGNFHYELMLTNQKKFTNSSSFKKICLYSVSDAKDSVYSRKTYKYDAVCGMANF